MVTCRASCFRHPTTARGWPGLFARNDAWSAFESSRAVRAGVGGPPPSSQHATVWHGVVSPRAFVTCASALRRPGPAPEAGRRDGPLPLGSTVVLAVPTGDCASVALGARAQHPLARRWRIFGGGLKTASPVSTRVERETGVAERLSCQPRDSFRARETCTTPRPAARPSNRRRPISTRRQRNGFGVCTCTTWAPRSRQGHRFRERVPGVRGLQPRPGGQVLSSGHAA